MKRFIGLLFVLSSVWAFRLQDVETQGSRIINGLPAIKGQFPWQAALFIQKDAVTIFCGGALISDSYVLTAAHCASNATQITVFLGSISLTAVDPNRLVVVTTSYTIYPTYDPITLENDVALINLLQPVAISDFIKPVNLDFSYLAPDVPLIVAGWGKTNDSVNAISDNLMYITVSSITNYECSFYFTDIIPAKQVCAIGFGQNICGGDSGSPLIAYDEATGLARHVGWGTFISSAGCEKNDPSGYTRTSFYWYWIRELAGINN